MRFRSGYIEENKSSNRQEGEPFLEEETVDLPWVLDTKEQPAVLVTDVVIAADSMKGSESPNQKQYKRACC
jgi:hypothetical protein